MADDTKKRITTRLFQPMTGEIYADNSCDGRILEVVRVAKHGVYFKDAMVMPWAVFRAGILSNRFTVLKSMKESFA